MTHHKYQYVVICRNGCGIQPLSEEQYLEQFSRPNSLWSCPRCGENASWDDECLETNPVMLQVEEVEIEPDLIATEKSPEQIVDACNDGAQCIVEFANTAYGDTTEKDKAHIHTLELLASRAEAISKLFPPVVKPPTT